MGEEAINRMQTLAEELVKLSGLRQGHLEIHVHDGEVTAMPKIDKSIKFKKKPTKIG
jgi:hypothetical protein